MIATQYGSLDGLDVSIGGDITLFLNSLDISAKNVLHCSF